MEKFLKYKLELKKWMKCIPNFDKNKSYGVSRGSFALSEAKKIERQR
jgi:hypothetical protein